jgi:hypothetical protein
MFAKMLFIGVEAQSNRWTSKRLNAKLGAGVAQKDSAPLLC